MFTDGLEVTTTAFSTTSINDTTILPLPLLLQVADPKNALGAGNSHQCFYIYRTIIANVFRLHQ